MSEPREIPQNILDDIEIKVQKDIEAYLLRYDPEWRSPYEFNGRKGVLVMPTPEQKAHEQRHLYRAMYWGSRLILSCIGNPDPDNWTELH